MPAKIAKRPRKIVIQKKRKSVEENAQNRGSWRQGFPRVEAQTGRFDAATSRLPSGEEFSLFFRVREWTKKGYNFDRLCRVLSKGDGENQYSHNGHRAMKGPRSRIFGEINMTENGFSCGKFGDYISGKMREFLRHKMYYLILLFYGTFFELKNDDKKLVNTVL